MTFDDICTLLQEKTLEIGVQWTLSETGVLRCEYQGATNCPMAFLVKLSKEAREEADPRTILTVFVAADNNFTSPLAGGEFRAKLLKACGLYPQEEKSLLSSQEAVTIPG